MQIGFRCPRGDVSYETCRTCRRDPLHPCGIPAPLLEYLERKSSEDEERNDRISPSRLLGCDRVPVLSKAQDYYLNVRHAFPTLRGDMIHSGLEKLVWHEGYTQVREMELSTWVGTQLFQAKPDVIVVHGVGEDPDFPDYLEVDIWDWKTREFEKSQTEADLNHVRQVWMYAYIVSKTASQWWAKTGRDNEQPPVRIRSVNICYISSSGSRIFSSLGTGVAYVDRGRGKTAYVQELALSPIPTYSLARVERFITERIELKTRSLTVLPRALEGDEAKWCFRCPVRHACLRVGEDEIAVEEAKKRLQQPPEEVSEAA
jgi:hypothetical protein